MSGTKGGRVDASGEKIVSVRVVTDMIADTGIGSAADPVRTDPTGTTVQPVSFATAQHVIVDSGGAGGGGNAAASSTGAAVPASAGYTGFNSGGNLVGVSSASPLPVTVNNFPVTQPVSGTFFQATQPVSIASMPSTPVTGTFFQATQPVSIASMPSTPVTGTFFQATQPVSIAAAVTVAQATLTKGTQGATGVSTQDLKDAGRTQVTLFALGLTGITTEALATCSITKGVVAQTAATSYTVTAGKTLRIQSIRATVSIPSTTGCSSVVRLRSAASSISASSPVIGQVHVGSPGATAFSTGTDDAPIPDGLEVAGGTQIAISHLESSAIAGSATTGAGLSFCLIGYEY